MKYAELIILPISAVQKYLTEHPDSVAADNALRELEHERKHKRRLSRFGKRTATISAQSHVRRKGHCPTKRLLAKAKATQ